MSDEKIPIRTLAVVMLQLGHLILAHESAIGAQPLTRFCKGNSEADGIQQAFSKKAK